MVFEEFYEFAADTEAREFVFYIDSDLIWRRLLIGSVADNRSLRFSAARMAKSISKRFNRASTQSRQPDY